MRFIVERCALAKMVALTRNGVPFRADTAALKLWACEGQVFVEAEELTCGIESLVLEDGACSLGRKRFLQLLKSYPGRKFLTIEADADGLRIGGFRMALASFSPDTSAPGEFQSFAPRWRMPHATAAELSPRVERPEVAPPRLRDVDEENRLPEMGHVPAGTICDAPPLAQWAFAWVLFVGDDAYSARLIKWAFAFVRRTEDAAGRVGQLIASVPTGEAACEWLERLGPVRVAVVLTALSAPHESALMLMRRLTESFPLVRVLFCAVSRSQAEQALAHGAFGVIRERASRAEFQHALSRVVAEPNQSSLAERPAQSLAVRPVATVEGAASEWNCLPARSSETALCPLVSDRESRSVKIRNTILGLHVGWALAFAMLAVAGYSEQPYGFYILLRWVACAVFTYSALTTYRLERPVWMWLFAAQAMLYNPFVRVHLDRETWQIFNWVSVACILAASAVFAKHFRRSNVE